MCRNSGIFRLGHLHGKDDLPVCHDIYGIFRRGHIPAVVAGHARTRLLKNRHCCHGKRHRIDTGRGCAPSSPKMSYIFGKDRADLRRVSARSQDASGNGQNPHAFRLSMTSQGKQKSRADIYIRSASLFIPRLLCLRSVEIMQEFPEYLLFQ